MKTFADISESSILDGDKIKIDSVIGKQIKVTGYCIKTSRYGENTSGKYLTLQVEINTEKKIIFTGSDVLIEQLEKYGNEIPFLATIRKCGKYYSLT